MLTILADTEKVPMTDLNAAIDDRIEAAVAPLRARLDALEAGTAPAPVEQPPVVDPPPVVEPPPVEQPPPPVEQPPPTEPDPGPTTEGDLTPGPDMLMAGMEMIPNFGKSPTVASAQDGPWGDPKTWTPSRTPGAGDVVRVDHEVVYGVASDAALAVVSVREGGCLHFDPTVSTRMVVGTLVVEMDGCLEIGDDPGGAVAPWVTAEVVFSGAVDTTADPKQYGLGLIGVGEVTVRGAPKTPFVRLAAEPKAGDATLALAEPVAGWRPGDVLLLPDSRQLPWTEWGNNTFAQQERPVLSAVSADGKALTLAAPLKFDHRGARDADGALVFLPHVANLTRNVSFSSADPVAARGHVLFTGRADVDVRYAAFRDLGRTTQAAIDNTTVDAQGKVTHVGTNQMARYPLHFHHLLGPAAARADGYQFSAVGNAVDGGSTSSRYRWGIDVHDSHYGLIRDNVVVDVAGVGIGTEDGPESYNVFDHNFVSGVSRTGSDPETTDDSTKGYAFWFRNPLNAVRGNVATCAATYGFGLWFYYTGRQPVPPRPGADMSEYQMVDMNGSPLREFSGNEAYGAIRGGLTTWWLGTRDADFDPAVATSTIQDLHVWHAWEIAVYQYPSNNLTYDGLKIIGDRAVLVAGQTSTGWTGSDYFSRNVVIANADIENVEVGVYASTLAGESSLTIRDSLLRNSRNLVVETPWTSASSGAGIPPRDVAVNNTTFNLANVPTVNSRAPVAIDMAYHPGGAANLVQPDRVFVSGYNRTAGDDFQVFYAQQAAGFVLPATTRDAQGNPVLVACPEAGLTNAQAWAKYDPTGKVKPDAPNPATPGLAVAGAIAPATAVKRAGINGLVAPTPPAAK